MSYEELVGEIMERDERTAATKNVSLVIESFTAQPPTLNDEKATTSAFQLLKLELSCTTQLGFP